MSQQRSISRVVNVPPASPGFVGPGHLAARIRMWITGEPGSISRSALHANDLPRSSPLSASTPTNTEIPVHTQSTPGRSAS